MRFILKILLAPVMLILAFLIWLCTLTLHISSVLLNILSVLLVLVSVFSFIDHNVKNGVIELVAAFLLSPYGLPMLGAWLVAQLHDIILAAGVLQFLELHFEALGQFFCVWYTEAAGGDFVQRLIFHVDVNSAFLS